jgi:hypothetical protein
LFFLGSVQTVYQLSQDIDDGRFQTLMECFTSTFEEVKTLAFDLLMKLSIRATQFQVLGLSLYQCKSDYMHKTLLCIGEATRIVQVLCISLLMSFGYFFQLLISFYYCGMVRKEEIW